MRHFIKDFCASLEAIFMTIAQPRRTTPSDGANIIKMSILIPNSPLILDDFFIRAPRTVLKCDILRI